MSDKIDFSNYLFRCSGLFNLMTEPQSNADKAAGKLSKTTETYLRDIFREEKYKRRKEFDSKYTRKGLNQEENAITLVSRVEKQFYVKNTKRLSNEWITGEPDASNTNDIETCTKGLDVKCSWSLFTFPFKDQKLNPAYEWQDHGYMFLTPAKSWETTYCLMNTDADEIVNEKKKLWYKFNMDDENPDYIKKCIELEKNSIFNMAEFKRDNPGFDFHIDKWDYDISLPDRVVSFEVKRQEEAFERIVKEVTKARKYLNELNNII